MRSSSELLANKNKGEGNSTRTMKNIVYNGISKVKLSGGVFPGDHQTVGVSVFKVGRTTGITMGEHTGYAAFTGLL